MMHRDQAKYCPEEVYSVCESFIGLEILNNINPTRKAVSETLTGTKEDSAN